MPKFSLKKKEPLEPAPGSGKQKKSKKRRDNQAVDRYHGPLITNEVSLGYIKFFPWLMLPFTAFLYFVAGHDDPIGIIKVLFLSATIINIASLLFGLFTPLINRFKSLTYILVALVVWTVTLTFTFIFLLMVTDDKTPFSALKLYESKLTLFYVIPIVLLFIVMTVIYAWYYLPQNQGKFGRLIDGKRMRGIVRKKNFFSISLKSWALFYWSLP